KREQYDPAYGREPDRRFFELSHRESRRQSARQNNPDQRSHYRHALFRRHYSRKPGESRRPESREISADLPSGGERAYHLWRSYTKEYFHAPGYCCNNLLLTGTPGSKVRSTNVTAGYTWVPSPGFVDNFVATFVRSASDRGQGGQTPQFNDFGSNVPQLPKSEGGIRAFSITNGYFGLGNFTDAKFIRNTYEFRDQAIWTHGSQTFTFGGNLEFDPSNIRNTNIENGSWAFSDTLSNLGLASFVVGHLHSYGQSSGDYSDSRQHIVGL